MPELSGPALDAYYMAQALRLARRGRYTTSPNPQVGCVIVRHGEVVGEGWHQYAGEGHAEARALQAAGEQARGASLYVTLEPCSHRGRTGPCAEAVVAAGVARVVAAMLDPNPLVSGGGVDHLRRHGIAVDVGVLEGQARELLGGFALRMERQRPRVRLKLATSLDGRVAMDSGESQWITGPPARLLGQQLRASSCAVVTGVGTVLADDCALNVRPEEWLQVYGAERVRQPLRVVVDSSLRTPPGARVLQAPGETVLVYAAAPPERLAALARAGATLVQMHDGAGRVDLAALCRWLAAERECNEVLVEAGPALAGAFIGLGLVDELHLFQAPVLLGSAAMPMAELPLVLLADAVRLQPLSRRQVGNDQYVVLRPVPPKAR